MRRCPPLERAARGHGIAWSQVPVASQATLRWMYGSDANRMRLLPTPTVARIPVGQRGPPWPGSLWDSSPAPVARIPVGQCMPEQGCSLLATQCVACWSRLSCCSHTMVSSALVLQRVLRKGAGGPGEDRPLLRAGLPLPLASAQGPGSAIPVKWTVSNACTWPAQQRGPRSHPGCVWAGGCARQRGASSLCSVPSLTLAVS